MNVTYVPVFKLTVFIEGPRSILIYICISDSPQHQSAGSEAHQQCEEEDPSLTCPNHASPGGQGAGGRTKVQNCLNFKEPPPSLNCPYQGSPGGQGAQGWAKKHFCPEKEIKKIRESYPSLTCPAHIDAGGQGAWRRLDAFLL